MSNVVDGRESLMGLHFKSKRKKILFLIGSQNQTTQMHQIAMHLREYDCYFSQFYSDSFFVNTVLSWGFLKTTILSGQFKETADSYLKYHGLKNDYRQQVYNNTYDLVVVCTDLMLPKSILKTKTIFVQEGMTDKLTTWGKIVRRLGLPLFLSGGTSLNGTSNLCDIYCVASEGYKQQFKSLGTESAKIVVTGIPNFDNVKSFMDNDFQLKAYVLVATSDIRETFGWENRKEFIQKVVNIANGRQLVFKLHPNENVERAQSEIQKYTPSDTLIFAKGNINSMIANCDELITQYSSVVYIGMALGKKVHSYFKLDQLRSLIPIQNEGISAKKIALICKEYLEYNGSDKNFPNHLNQVSQNYLLQIDEYHAYTIRSNESITPFYI